MSISLIDLKHFLAHYPLEVQEIFMGVREVVYSVVPEVVEDFHLNGISYLRPGDGKEAPSPLKTGLCHVVADEEKVQVGFWHGAFLPDPQEILQGDRKAKRFIDLDSYEDTPWEALEALLAAAAEFDPYKTL